MNNDYDVDDSVLPDLPIAARLESRGGNYVAASKKGKKEPLADGSDQKTRRPRPKLDYERLLKGNRGFKHLLLHTKHLVKVTGKAGNEAQDLSQVLFYLQEWAQQVFPKMTLAEFLLKVEDLCQSRLMKLYLGDLTKTSQNFEDLGEEFLSKMAAQDAHKAIENLESLTTLGKTAKPAIRAESAIGDFDLDGLLAEKEENRANRKHSDRDRNTEFAEDDFTDSDPEDDAAAAMDEEMADFINDASSDEDDAAESEAESEVESANEHDFESENEGAIESEIESDFEASDLVKKPKTLTPIIDGSEDEEAIEATKASNAAGVLERSRPLIYDETDSE